MSNFTNNTATILNLTQHTATADQVAAGVIDVLTADRKLLTELLTVPAFELIYGELPTYETWDGYSEPPAGYDGPGTSSPGRDPAECILDRANRLARFAIHAFGVATGGDPWADPWCPTFAGTRVMIGGLPALQAPLARALAMVGFRPVFAVSDRVSVDVTQPDGSVRKVSEFRHLGFVSATLCVSVDD